MCIHLYFLFLFKSIISRLHLSGWCAYTRECKNPYTPVSHGGHLSRSPSSWSLDRLATAEFFILYMDTFNYFFFHSDDTELMTGYLYWAVHLLCSGGINECIFFFVSSYLRVWSCDDVEVLALHRRHHIACFEIIHHHFLSLVSCPFGSLAIYKKSRENH